MATDAVLVRSLDELAEIARAAQKSYATPSRLRAESEKNSPAMTVRRIGGFHVACPLAQESFCVGSLAQKNSFLELQDSIHDDA